MSYPQMLANLTAPGCLLAVAGTHGKSTTTALAAQALIDGGLDPTVCFGAAWADGRPGGRDGGGPLSLVEACEYRRHFLGLLPKMAVLLGVEADHFDCYQDLREVESAFTDFVNRVPPGGLIVANGDCPRAVSVTRHARARVVFFGLSPQRHWSARIIDSTRGRYQFDIHRRARHFATIELQIPGRHNVVNALAAAALCGELGMDRSQVAEALHQFPGLQRRMETLGVFRGVTFMDDYAHHPTEITAALTAAREMHPQARLVCVFQPHQASRTRRLLDELAGSLHNVHPAVDKVYIADIYRAREAATAPGDVTAEDLARKLRKRGSAVARLHRPAEIAAHLAEELREGDVLITLGAGDIGNICHDLADGFQTDRAA